ncbi:MAG: FACT complex subunit ssrp1 [Marteilia pararefringens]
MAAAAAATATSSINSNLVRNGRNIPGKISLLPDSVRFNDGKSLSFSIERENMFAFKWRNYNRGRALQIQSNGPESTYVFQPISDGDKKQISNKVKQLYDREVSEIFSEVTGDISGELNNYYQQLEFNNEATGKQYFTVPVENISHVSSSRSVLTIQFTENCPIALSEMKFHVLTDTNQPDIDYAAKVVNGITSSNPSLSSTGNEILKFSNVTLLSPRGKYDITAYKNKFQLFGKTFNYSVLFENIRNFLLLPNEKKKICFLVMNLKSPIRQSKLSYNSFCFQFNSDSDLPLDILFTDGTVDENLKKQIESLGAIHYNRDKLSKIISTICGITPITTHQLYLPVEVTMKTATGMLYFLENGIAFLPKNYFYYTMDEINSIHEVRVSQDRHYFDFAIELKDSKEIIFTNVAQ